MGGGEQIIKIVNPVFRARSDLRLSDVYLGLQGWAIISSAEGSW